MSLRSHHRITLILTLVIAVLLIGIFSFLQTSLTSRSFERTRKELISKTVLTRSLLEERVSGALKAQEADRIADMVGRELGLRVTVIKENGVVLGDSELDGQALSGVENHLYRKEVQQALNAGLGESRRFSTTIQKDMLYIGVPFERPSGRGVVRLSIPLTEIDMISEGLTKLLVGALLTAFLIAIFVTFLASSLITQPIKRISSVAQSIAAGDFSRRAIVGGHDEIAELGTAINHMSEQIKARMEEVMSGRSRLEAVLLSMFEGVMVLDPKGHILLMNEALRELFHVEYDPVGQSPIEVIRNVDLPEIIQKAQELSEGVVSREIHVFLPDEKDIWVHATPVVREGTREGVVLVFHDITELRKLEKVRKDFVANVSHELRTPVSNIKGYAETLLDGALKDKKNAREFVEIIDKDSKRLAQLINDLLDLSKIESGKLKLELSACDAKAIVERIFTAVGKKAEEKGLTIKTDIPSSLSKVLADELSIAQALLNLTENAIRYNKEEGEVLIRLAEDGDKVVFSVIDTGIGMAAEHLPRIFERFYRVDKARSREQGGTGLGLSIVKHIVQEHQGEVFVESEPGKGSSFSFSIPKA